MDTLALAFLMTLFPLMAILKTFLDHKAYNPLTTNISLNQNFPSGLGIHWMDGKQLFVFRQHGNSNFMANHPFQRNQIMAPKKVIRQVTRRVIVQSESQW